MPAFVASSHPCFQPHHIPQTADAHAAAEAQRWDDVARMLSNIKVAACKAIVLAGPHLNNMVGTCCAVDACELLRWAAARNA